VRHFRRLGMRVVLVIAVCFSAVSITQADAIATLYTGSFPVATNGSTVWQPWNFQVAGLLMGTTPLIQYGVSLSAPITHFEVTPPCGPGCPQYFTGNLNSGSFSFQGVGPFGQFQYNFTGNITPGGSITGGVTCDSFGCSWFESVLVDFVGQPSNGVQSTGYMILDGASYGTGGGDSGYLNMVSTPLPEPNSIALLGSGIIASVGALRRRRRQKPLSGLTRSDGLSS
jgi:PEP-CTERM motif